MTGTQITIEHEDFKNLSGELGDLIEQLDKPRIAMAEIAGYLEEITRDNFDKQQAPDGTPWAPLSPRYQKRKAKLGVPINKILHGETLNLRDHMHPAWTDSEASISTSGETSMYAATQFFGDKRRNIPARVFMGLNEKNKLEILDILDDHIKLGR